MSRTPLDPDRLRTSVLDALHALPGEVELEALHAVERGEIEIDDDPAGDELHIQIGDVTVVVERARCESVDESSAEGSVP